MKDLLKNQLVVLVASGVDDVLSLSGSVIATYYLKPQAIGIAVLYLTTLNLFFSVSLSPISKMSHLSQWSDDLVSKLRPLVVLINVVLASASLVVAIMLGSFGDEVLLVLVVVTLIYAVCEGNAAFVISKAEHAGDWVKLKGLQLFSSVLALCAMTLICAHSQSILYFVPSLIFFPAILCVYFKINPVIVFFNLPKKLKIGLTLIKDDNTIIHYYFSTTASSFFRRLKIAADHYLIAFIFSVEEVAIFSRAWMLASLVFSRVPIIFWQVYLPYLKTKFPGEVVAKTSIKTGLLLSAVLAGVGLVVIDRVFVVFVGFLGDDWKVVAEIRWPILGIGILSYCAITYYYFAIANLQIISSWKGDAWAGTIGFISLFVSAVINSHDFVRFVETSAIICLVALGCTLILEKFRGSFS